MTKPYSLRLREICADLRQAFLKRHERIVLPVKIRLHATRIGWVVFDERVSDLKRFVQGRYPNGVPDGHTITLWATRRDVEHGNHLPHTDITEFVRELIKE